MFFFLRVQMVLGGVVYTAVPFYKRVRKVEGTYIHNPIVVSFISIRYHC